MLTKRTVGNVFQGVAVLIAVGATSPAAAVADLSFCSSDTQCGDDEYCSILEPGTVVTLPGEPEIVLPVIGICAERPAEAESRPTDTPTLVFTATPTWTPGPSCHGDCDGDGFVSVDELVRVVNIASDVQPIESCDEMADYRSLGIDDLVLAVNMSLHGCE